VLLDLLVKLTPVWTTLAGGLIGFLAARLMWQTQVRHERKNLAQGLLLDLQSLQGGLTTWTNVYRNPPEGATVRADTPFYPAAGLYYAVQKEISSFPADLSRALFRFYSTVLQAEALRTFPVDRAAAHEVHKVVGAALTRATEQLPSLMERLSRELDETDRREILAGAR
jgi:hypothetical protein